MPLFRVVHVRVLRGPSEDLGSVITWRRVVGEGYTWGSGWGDPLGILGGSSTEMGDPV